MSDKQDANHAALSDTARLRAQIKDARAEIASAKTAAKNTLRDLKATQHAQIANAHHDGYLSGVADAKVIFEKNRETAKKEIAASQKKIESDFPAIVGHKPAVTKKSKKNVTKKQTNKKVAPKTDNAASLTEYTDFELS